MFLKNLIAITLFALLLGACTSNAPISYNTAAWKYAPSGNIEKPELIVDERSYKLGGIGAFGELVNIGIKKLALSAASLPEDMDAIIDEAKNVAKRNNVEIYREDDFLVTDLFPASVTEGKHVLLIYQGETKQEYLDLKVQKEQLIESNQYTDKARKEIARRFGEMLSYPEWKIDELISSNVGCL